MNSLQTNYQALISDENEAPLESVIFHVAAENGKTRWNHVGDLDAFFRRIYTFHQKRGLIGVLVEHAIWVILFMLIAFGFIYCLNCINFNFHEPYSPLYNKTDVLLSDLFIPLSVCAPNHFGFGSWLLVVLATIVVVYRIYMFFCNCYIFKEIQQFYESAMKISKAETQNITWHEVQCRLREVQHEQQMCVHSHDLTELNISHRILRYTNYMVAMVNKNILPLRFHTKYFGEWIYYTSTLDAALHKVLFTHSSSPFGGTGKLREEYKKSISRQEAAADLSKWILYYGVRSALMAPFQISYQVLSFLISYSGFLRYEPGFLAKRRWSHYSRLYLRHFNEMDHELDARLCRAYKPSTEYMKYFNSPLVAQLIKVVSQPIGFVIVFFTAWGLFSERLFTVPYVLLIISVGASTFMSLVSCLSDEYETYNAKELMKRIVAEIHYVPDHFKKAPHTTAVRDEFSHYFQYVVVYLLEELLASLFIPYVLLFHIRPRSLDIVDFLRNFTVEVQGVGDVCSFALMDVSKHGDPQWTGQSLTKADIRNQAEFGKTELSLIHFSLMNPNWEPPPASHAFMEDFKEQVYNAARQQTAANGQAFYSSLNSLSTMGSKYASLVQSVHQSMHEDHASGGFSTSGPHLEKQYMRGLNNAEGPFEVQNSILTSEMDSPSLQTGLNPLEIRAADMSMSALFLHQVHDNYIASSEVGSSGHSAQPQPRNVGNEDSPLLEEMRYNYVQ
ncbi:hypothetical protein JTE90_012119 [Oedothorax gibbosus]|uniref:Autophagy-related protein 9 n=1 Tax=Oedothorax gibbosus TaxID=931172 RepID=A0AAV6UVD5_9ARAC|nr:hypothetical protein JTE90_012119 [Oedothorax gibbosus]